MKKLKLLRHYLLNTPALKLESEQLHIATRRGQLTSRVGHNGLHFNNPVELLVTDYAGDIEVFAYLLTRWLNRYEPERPDDIEFEAELLNGELSDLLFRLPLTHNLLPVPAGEGEGENEGTHLYWRDEIPADDIYTGPVELYLKSEKIAEWQAPDNRARSGSNLGGDTLPELESNLSEVKT